MHFSMHLNTPSVSIVLDKRKMTTSGDHKGKYHIKLRVTFNVIERGKKRWVQKLYKTYLFAGSEEELNTILSRPKSEEHKEIKPKLIAMQHKAEQLIKDHGIVDQEAFELHFLSTGSVRGIEQMFLKKIKQMQTDDKISTAEKYETALRVIKQFSQHLNKSEDVFYGDVTAKWLDKFKKWYVTERGRSLASYAFHVRALRHIFNMAIAAKLITMDQYPFGSGKFSIPAVRRPLKRYLTIEEKNKFLEYIPKAPHTAEAKDYWMFSYFCNGMNFADIANLRRRDVFEEYILISRTKTLNSDNIKKKILIPITPIALEIIARRGNKSLAPDDYVFPILESGMNVKERFAAVRRLVFRINKNLKPISEDLQIGKITTYTARHTFANVILQSGGSIELIQDLLGHGEKKTTENYVDGFSLDIKKKFASKL
jgi:integrase/recombinase XerD